MNEVPTEYITYQYNGGLWCETHRQASDHSIIIKTIYFQPHRIIIDPGARGGGDQVIYYLMTDSMGSCMGLMDTSGSVVAGIFLNLDLNMQWICLARNI